MAITAKTLRQLSETSFDYLASNTNLTKLSPGGKARALLDAANQSIAEAYQIFDLNLARAFISSAPGQYLDLIGILLAEPRSPAAVAIVDSQLQNIKWYVDSGTFGDINGGNPFVIPRGTIISSSSDYSGVVFKTTNSVSCDASASGVWVSAQASSAGADSNVGANSLIYHDFNSYVDYLNVTLKVTNVYPVVQGKDYESDANYRYRLTQKVTAAEAANEIALRLAVLSTAGVADALIKKYYRGIGTFGVVVKSVQPSASDSLLENVRLSVDLIQGFSSIAYIRAQKELGYTMKTRVWYKKKLTDDEISTIETDLIGAVSSYVNALDMGEAFYADRLIASLFGISEYIIGFGSTTSAIDESYLYKATRLEDNRVPGKLLGDYAPEEDERIIIEPTVTSPVTFVHTYGSRISES